jgi:hypothetical protein
MSTRRCAAAVLAFTVLTGCRRGETTAEERAPAASKRPVDRLLPGELAEGRERAMGLVVPRDMRIERVFDDSAVARGRVGVEPLADYVRKRVQVASVEVGQSRTVFPKAHPRGAPEGKLVRIEIARDLETTVLTLTDVTPPPIPNGLSEDERWRKAGVLPGKPFDPNAL